MEGPQVLPSAADTLVLPLILLGPFWMCLSSVRRRVIEPLVGDAAARYWGTQTSQG